MITMPCQLDSQKLIVHMFILLLVHMFILKGSGLIVVNIFTEMKQRMGQHVLMPDLSCIDGFPFFFPAPAPIPI